MSRYTVENGPSWISSLSQMSPQDDVRNATVEANISKCVFTEANRNGCEVVVKDVFKCS